MLQFILGLAAGIVVTLIMEWVIDWSGLAAGRTMVRARSSATSAPGPGQPTLGKPSSVSSPQPTSTTHRANGD